MKTPCEIVVWYVLPSIRREIAKELVEAYNMKQAEVGRLFGVTDAAISQYLKKKRGGNELIEGSRFYPQVLEEVKKCAKRVYDRESEMVTELCRICTFVRQIGLLAEIYAETTGGTVPQCALGSVVRLDEL